jgi:RIO kinase 1
MPDGLAPLIDDGIIQRVLRPLMSGKEAQVYLVEARGNVCVAKVYKEAHNRSFKNRAEYTEGRRTRNSRDQRAIQKRSKHGRAQDEAAWRSTEVDMIHRLHAGGVRVPVPYIFIDGVLVMECIGDHEGNPAPRLSDLSLDPDTAYDVYRRVIQEVVRMLAVGVVHGDLSEFNVLIGSDGPVIIDFPQSVDTASNTNARRLLMRDVENFHRFLARSVPNAPRLPYAEEMWDLHELNALTAETRLTGRYRAPQRRMSTESVRDLIHDADRDERKRRDALGLRGGPQAPPPPARGQAPQHAPHQRSQAPQHAPQHAPQRGQAPQHAQQQRTSAPQHAPQHAPQRGPRPEQPQRTHERPNDAPPPRTRERPNDAPPPREHTHRGPRPEQPQHAPQQRSHAPQRGPRPEQPQHAPQQRSHAPQRGPRPEPSQQPPQRGPRPEQPQRTRERPNDAPPQRQAHPQHGRGAQQPSRAPEQRRDERTPQREGEAQRTRTPARNRSGPAPEVIIVRRPPR